MHHFASQIIDLLLVLLAAWMVLAIIFAIYAYFARLKYPVSESVFGRVVVVSFFIITHRFGSQLLRAPSPYR
jgi:hypothetical protein